MVAVLNPLRSLLVLLLFFFGDFRFSFLMSYWFRWSCCFLPVVFSIVISLVAFYVLIACLVVIGLFEIAWLLKLIGRLLLLVRWSDVIAML